MTEQTKTSRNRRTPSRSEVRQARRERERLMWQHRIEGNQQVDEAQLLQGYRRLNLIKWGLGFAGVGMLLFTGLTMFALIVTPIWFRSLPTSEQVIWEGRIPLLASFRPTREYNADRLPTAASDDNNVMALLSTPVASPTIPQTLDGPLVSGNQVILPGQTATQAPPVLPANVAPTSILATNTPVLAPVEVTPTLRVTRAAIQPTPSATPTIPPPPPATAIPVPLSYQAVGFRFEKQQWNTCGPANLTQALHFLKWEGTQKQIENYVKPNREDRNVSPDELVNFVNMYVNGERGVPIKALMRYSGDLNMVKRLVANNFAVILEKGYNLPEEGWLGHYLTIQGYDDQKRQMHGLDTYLGDRWEDYDQLDQRWQQFNRLYIVLYPADRERELAILLGPHADLNYNIKYALSVARREASEQPSNPYAYFNVGTNYTLLGQHKEAAAFFDKARDIGTGLPFRMFWYQFGPYEAYYNSGDYAQVLALTQATLGTSQDLEESHFWRGMALAATGNTDEAIREFQRALNINPKFQPAVDALEKVRSGTFKPPR